MPRQKGERNSAIVRLLRSGGSPSDIASQFNVSPGRVAQIVVANDALDRLRAALQKKYGARPNIRQLSDQTPIEVLMLCDADMHGWAVRVKALRQAATPIKTIGNLRRMTDEELLRIPGVGSRMLQQLRSCCPRHSAGKKA